MQWIAGQWEEGGGETFSSQNPFTEKLLWKGNAASPEQVEKAVQSGQAAFKSWRRLSLEERFTFLLKGSEAIKKKRDLLEKAVSEEVGKPLWESKQELDALLSKYSLAHAAYQERSPTKILSPPSLHLTHKPHGVMAILGPFNFPAHLPHSHMIPALLAGNCVILKGSELTPSVTTLLTSCFEELPPGVFQMVQGGGAVGERLAHHPLVNGVLFTGSYATGKALLKATPPEKLLALEMGGNNPLVVSEIEDLEAAAYTTLLSAFLTAGQRCTSARRLILPTGKEGDAFLELLLTMTEALHIGPYTDSPEPFMGPVIAPQAATHLLETQERLVKRGGKVLKPLRPLTPSLLAPGLIDVTSLSQRPDEEIFGPLLQVIRVPHFEAALHEAQSHYGLAAALLSSSKARFEQFLDEVRAGVINWNAPTVGASSQLPFGGVGWSGNFHPSGYYAADYCAYPVATTFHPQLTRPSHTLPGVLYDLR